MVAYISGKLTFKSPRFITLDVSGIGFKIFVPLSTYYKLPDVNHTTRLFTYLHVKNEVFSLYGFLTEEEMEVFEILLSVASIGPRIATNVLSELSVGEFKSAVLEENLKILTSIPGVGKKIAQRILLEVKEKIEGISAEIPQEGGRKEIINDAISALVSLGYSYNSSREAVEKSVKAFTTEFSLEKLIKKALEFLR